MISRFSRMITVVFGGKKEIPREKKENRDIVGKSKTEFISEIPVKLKRADNNDDSLLNNAETKRINMAEESVPLEVIEPRSEKLQSHQPLVASLLDKVEAKIQRKKEENNKE